MLIIVIILVSIPLSLEIYGGRDASIEDFPHHVAIEHHGTYLCAGAIVSSRRVVTVAHCVFGHQHKNLTIRAGTSVLKTGGSLHPVIKVDVHEDYALNRGRLSRIFNFNALYASDIAVVHVDEPFERQPIKLFSQGEEARPGDPAIVTGWGRTRENLMSGRLQFADVEIIDRSLCELAYSEDGGLSEGKICAGRYRVLGLTKDSCTGDSGGGLVVAGRLAGLVAYGKKCGLPDYPGVYTEIALFSDWIKARL